MYNLLKVFLQKEMIEFTEDMFAETITYFTPKKVKRREIIVRPGGKMRYLYFVNSGCIRLYYVNRRDQDRTADIALEGVFNILTADFVQNKPSMYYVEALETSELLAIPWPGFKLLALKYLDFFFCIFHMTAVRRENHFTYLLSAKSAAAYTWLRKRHPEIIERISDKIIASYLGVSPRTLVRAKAGAKKVGKPPATRKRSRRHPR